MRLSGNGASRVHRHPRPRPPRWAACRRGESDGSGTSTDTALRALASMWPGRQDDHTKTVMKSGPMGIGRRRRGRLVVIACVMMLWALTAGRPASAQSPFGCNTPVSQRPSEVGCYFTASEVLGALTQSQVFWHLYQYPTRAAAEAARGPHGTVVESFGKVWLYSSTRSPRTAGSPRVAPASR